MAPIRYDRKQLMIRFRKIFDFHSLYVKRKVVIYHTIFSLMLQCLEFDYSKRPTSSQIITKLISIN